MASKKPRNKAYRPKYAGENVKLKMQPWKVAAVFNPLEAIINQLETHGTVDAARNGTAIFRDAIDGHWYESSAAIIGVVDAYEIHEIRTGRSMDLEPLRRLANKLKYDMPIFQTDTDDCRACFTRMKRETIEMTAGYARDLIKDFHIKEELLKVAA